MPRTDPTSRFSNRVADYVRARPSYPGAVIDLLTPTAGSNAAIADVGSGTGIFARQLLDAGHTVFAVEPNDAMRTAAEMALAHRPAFHSIAATAEATTPPDHNVAMVTAAQAFHWFDRAAFRVECLRILRPGGRVALIWNDRQTRGSSFLERFEALLERLGTDYVSVRHRNVGEDGVAAFFAPARFERHAFQNGQSLDFDALRARLLSSSYAPPADDPRSRPMLAALRELFDATQQGGRVEMTYETQVFLGRLDA